MKIFSITYTKISNTKAINKFTYPLTPSLRSGQTLTPAPKGLTRVGFLKRAKKQHRC